MLLSEGIVETVVNGGFAKPPFVLQILRIEAFKEWGPELCILSMSDGIDSDVFCILPMRLNHMVESGELAENTVVRIMSYIETKVSGANKTFKFLYITNLEVLIPGGLMGKRIGEPRFSKWKKQKHSERFKVLLKSKPKISKGVLSEIMSGSKKVHCPLLQVLGIRKIINPDYEKCQYQLILSDSYQICNSMLHDDLFFAIHNGSLKTNSVICLLRYYKSNAQIEYESGPVIVVMDLEILAYNSEETCIDKTEPDTTSSMVPTQTLMKASPELTTKTLSKKLSAEESSAAALASDKVSASASAKTIIPAMAADKATAKDLAAAAATCRAPAPAAAASGKAKGDKPHIRCHHRGRMAYLFKACFKPSQSYLKETSLVLNQLSSIVLSLSVKDWMEPMTMVVGEELNRLEPPIPPIFYFSGRYFEADCECEQLEKFYKEIDISNFDEAQLKAALRLVCNMLC